MLIFNAFNESSIVKIELFETYLISKKTDFLIIKNVKKHLKNLTITKKYSEQILIFEQLYKIHQNYKNLIIQFYNYVKNLKMYKTIIIKIQ